MEIKFLGSSSFVISGKKESVLINPHPEMLDKGKLNARIIAVTEEGMKVNLKDDHQVQLAGPGEYEVGGIEVKGYASGSGTTIYVFTVDDVEVGYLGNLEEPLSDKKIEKIDKVDVLLAPVSGKNIGDGKMVSGWAKKWGANYLIPFGYEEDGKLKKFLDEVDSESLEPVSNLKTTKDSLPEGMEIVVLGISR